MLKSFVAGVCALGLLLAMCLVAYAGAKPVGANLQVTDSGLGSLGTAEGPDVAGNGATLYAVWRDSRAPPISVANAKSGRQRSALPVH
jgi:hypothetical protein